MKVDVILIGLRLTKLFIQNPDHLISPNHIECTLNPLNLAVRRNVLPKILPMQ